MDGPTNRWTKKWVGAISQCAGAVNHYFSQFKVTQNFASPTCGPTHLHTVCTQDIKINGFDSNQLTQGHLHKLNNLKND